MATGGAGGAGAGGLVSPELVDLPFAFLVDAGVVSAAADAAAGNGGTSCAVVDDAPAAGNVWAGVSAAAADATAAVCCGTTFVAFTSDPSPVPVMPSRKEHNPWYIATAAAAPATAYGNVITCCPLFATSPAAVEYPALVLAGGRV